MRQVIIGISLIFLALVLVNPMVMAETNQSQAKYVDVATQLDIDIDGSLIVDEQITINVNKNDDIYVQTSDISNVSGIKNLTVLVENTQGEMVALEPVESIEDIQEQSYYFETVYEDKIWMKLYIPTKLYRNQNNQLNYHITYQATDFVSVYNDGAYLEWPILTNGNEVLNNFLLEVTYSQAVNEQVYPMVSGALFQREMQMSDWTSRIVSTHIKANEPVVFSALIPKSFCLDSRKLIDANQADQIIEEQNQYKIEQIEQEKKVQTASALMMLLNNIPIVLLIIATILFYIGFDRKNNAIKSKQNKVKIPTNYSPAELRYQSGKKVGFTEVYTTMLDLCNRRIIRYKEMEGEIVFLIDDIAKAQTLKRHERYLVNWIFNARDTDKVTLSELLIILGQDATASGDKRFNIWIKAVAKQTQKLIAGEPILFIRMIGVVVTAMNVVLSCISIYRFGNIPWSAAVMVSSLLLLIYAYSLEKYNEEEQLNLKESKEFLAFFKVMGKGETPTLAYKEWQTLIPYAMSFNQVEPVIEAISNHSEYNENKGKEAVVRKNNMNVELAVRAFQKMNQKTQ
jgi:uncharacterized membrane protein